MVYPSGVGRIICDGPVQSGVVPCGEVLCDLAGVVVDHVWHSVAVGVRVSVRVPRERVIAVRDAVSVHVAVGVVSDAVAV